MSSGGKIRRLTLFEFDERFKDKYPDQFVRYDYNQPLDVPDELKSAFDVLVVDPPFISDECMVKVAQTVRLLSKPDTRVIFCTGASMEELVSCLLLTLQHSPPCSNSIPIQLYRLLKLRRATFKPQHRRNLANEFTSYTNYNSISL